MRNEEMEIAKTVPSRCCVWIGAHIEAMSEVGARIQRLFACYFKMKVSKEVRILMQ